MDRDTTEFRRAAESLPVRRDAVALLEYIRDNKVTGTQSANNMPLKAVRETAALFVEPPQLDHHFPHKTFKLRSEEEIGPIHSLRVIAEVGGLIKTGAARRWRLTPQGARFLAADPRLQTAFLLAIWWHRINWLFACPVTGLGDRLPPELPAIAYLLLCAPPPSARVPFEMFADAAIAHSGLRWAAPDLPSARSSLRWAIRRMVIEPLRRFGALECMEQEEPLGGGTISKLVAFRFTPWGVALLESVGVVAR